MNIRRLERAMMLVEIRREGMHPELASELDHFMVGVDREPEDWPDGYIEADALADAEDFVLNAIADGCRSADLRAIRTQLRDAEIALGLVVSGAYLDARHTQWSARPAYRQAGVTYYWQGSCW